MWLHVWAGWCPATQYLRQAGGGGPVVCSRLVGLTSALLHPNLPESGAQCTADACHWDAISLVGSVHVHTVSVCDVLCRTHTLSTRTQLSATGATTAPTSGHRSTYPSWSTASSAWDHSSLPWGSNWQDTAASESKLHKGFWSG